MGWLKYPLQVCVSFADCAETLKTYVLRTSNINKAIGDFLVSHLFQSDTNLQIGYLLTHRFQCCCKMSSQRFVSGTKLRPSGDFLLKDQQFQRMLLQGHLLQAVCGSLYRPKHRTTLPSVSVLHEISLTVVDYLRQYCSNSRSNMVMLFCRILLTVWYVYSSWETVYVYLPMECTSLFAWLTFPWSKPWLTKPPKPVLHL